MDLIGRAPVSGHREPLFPSRQQWQSFTLSKITVSKLYEQVSARNYIYEHVFLVLIVTNYKFSKNDDFRTINF